MLPNAFDQLHAKLMLIDTYCDDSIPKAFIDHEILLIGRKGHSVECIVRTGYGKVIRQVRRVICETCHERRSTRKCSESLANG